MDSDSELYRAFHPKRMRWMAAGTIAGDDRDDAASDGRGGGDTSGTGWYDPATQHRTEAAARLKARLDTEVCW